MASIFHTLPHLCGDDVTDQLADVIERDDVTVHLAHEAIGLFTDVSAITWRTYEDGTLEWTELEDVYGHWEVVGLGQGDVDHLVRLIRDRLDTATA